MQASLNNPTSGVFSEFEPLPTVKPSRVLKPSEFFRCQFMRPAGYWVRASDGKILKSINEQALRS